MGCFQAQALWSLSQRYFLETLQKARDVGLPLSMATSGFSDLWLKHIIIPSQKGQIQETSINHPKKDTSGFTQLITGLGAPGENGKVWPYSSPHLDQYLALEGHSLNTYGVKKKNKQKKPGFEQIDKRKSQNLRSLRNVKDVPALKTGTKIILHYFLLEADIVRNTSHAMISEFQSQNNSVSFPSPIVLVGQRRKQKPEVGSDLTKVTHIQD